MEYFLKLHVINRVPKIEISKEEYEDLEKSRHILSNSLSIEEIYEIVISNYIELERQIVSITTTSMIQQSFDYSDFFEVRLGLNIRLINLLTAVRLYVDQLNHKVRECVPDEINAKERVKKFLSNEYDNNLEYRFMEALRNYVQHRGIPVHLIRGKGTWIALDGAGLLEYNFELYSQRSHLEDDGEFKKIVLKELEDDIDLKAMTRGYIESISNIHDLIRDLISEPVRKAREIIEHAHTRYSAEYDGNLTALRAYKKSDGKILSFVPLLLDWDNIRSKLQSRNKKLINLRKRYVTNKLNPRKNKSP